MIMTDIYLKDKKANVIFTRVNVLKDSNDSYLYVVAGHICDDCLTINLGSFRDIDEAYAFHEELTQKIREEMDLAAKEVINKNLSNCAK